MKAFPLTLFLIFVSVCQFANAGWTLVVTKDAMTDEIRKEAVTSDSLGNTVTLRRDADNRVWFYFQLASPQQFRPNDKVLLRVDTHEPRSYGPMYDRLLASLDGHKKSYSWTPRIVAALTWHGNAKHGCGILDELVPGKKMLLRYHPSDLTYVDLDFDIAGSKAVLEQALDMKIDDCAEESSLAKEVNAIMESHRTGQQ
ncbi:hypothetical protein [Bowmanella denitrificans]|uniref:hypothetical protein n=1 Tax=Bowmanella denitrificans TaxID=366582 RepID=UPI000C9C3FFC|nr:hypothetical protein [Bowmanella denitrificans]